MRLDSYSGFLDAWFGKIEKSGINVIDLPLDHLGYSTGSSFEYDEVKREFLEVSRLVREVIISNRRVGVFELNKPLKYKTHSIRAVELVEPVAGEEARTGFEHAEFTLNASFEDFVAKYPNVAWNIKNIHRKGFPRLKIVFDNKMELKFNLSPILE